MEESIFLAVQFEHPWGKKSSGHSNSSMGESSAGSGLSLECCREEVGGRGEPCSFRYSDPWFHLWLTVMFLSSLPRVLVGKPSSFFPEDSFIDSGEIDVGRRASQKIPPGTFWRSQVFIDHPVHLKFNVSLGKAALVGIYGRKGLPPSHTQVTRTLCTLLLSRGSHLKS